jgi:hypothetical protein
MLSQLDCTYPATAGKLRLQRMDPAGCNTVTQLTTPPKKHWQCGFRVLVFNTVSSQFLDCHARLTIEPYDFNTATMFTVTWMDLSGCAKTLKPFGQDGTYDFEFQETDVTGSITSAPAIPLQALWAVGDQENEIVVCVMFNASPVTFVPNNCKNLNP